MGVATAGRLPRVRAQLGDRRSNGDALVPSGWDYSATTALTVLTSVVAATVGLMGFVVTVSVLVVQMATGTFSARYMRLWYRDNVFKATLAVLLGTMRSPTRCCAASTSPSPTSA